MRPLWPAGISGEFPDARIVVSIVSFGGIDDTTHHIVTGRMAGHESRIEGTSGRG
jgi:hypothetical protein